MQGGPPDRWGQTRSRSGDLVGRLHQLHAVDLPAGVRLLLHEIKRLHHLAARPDLDIAKREELDAFVAKRKESMEDAWY